MRLVYEALQHELDFENTQVHIVVLESPGFMRDFIGTFIKQTNGEAGGFVLSEKSKELVISKNVSVVIDYFSLSLNDRKIIAKLYDNLTNTANDEDMYLLTNELQGKINEYMGDLLFKVDQPLTYSEEYKLSDLFKMMDVRFDENDTTLLERVSAYIGLCNSFLKLKLLVFVNLRSYLSDKELEELYNQIRYYNIKLLLVEHCLTSHVLPQEKVLVVDKDLCEI